MAKATKETIKEEIDKAITADEQANANYYGAIRGFTLAMLTTAGTNMDAASLKEIEAAWVTKESSGKNLRRAYMKLFGFRVWVSRLENLKNSNSNKTPYCP